MKKEEEKERGRKMKKKLLAGWMCACLLLGTGTVPADAAGNETADGISGEDTAVGQNVDEDIYRTIPAYVNNRAVWEVDDNFGYAQYGVLDLEGDGIPELYSSTMSGNGFFSTNEFFKVNPESGTVSEIKNVPEDLVELDLDGSCSIYQEKSTGQLFFLSNDLWRSGWQENGSNWGMFHMQNGTLGFRWVWGRRTTVDNNMQEHTKYYYFNDAGSPVTVGGEAQWQQYQDNYLSRFTLIAETTPCTYSSDVDDAGTQKLTQIFRDLYDQLYQAKLDAADYIAFSSMCYTDVPAGDLNKSLSDLMAGSWENSWENSAIKYKELLADIPGWKVIGFETIPGTGFAACAYQNPFLNKVVIAYRGSHELTDVGEDLWRDWVENDFAMMAGIEGAQLKNAFDFYESVQKKTGSQDIVVTGHSLGGGLADIVAARYGCEGQSFNSAPFLDVVYWHRPDEMAEKFTGADQLSFIAHVNEKDNLVGNWGSEIIKPKMLYQSNTDNFLAAHGLGTMVRKDANNKVVMNTVTGDQTAKGLIEQRTSRISFDHVILGTSKEDFVRRYNGLFDFAAYGGDGPDDIGTPSSEDVLAGGKGTDSLDGNRGDDTYIYYKGDQADLIHDISGQDNLVLYGFPKSTKIEVVEHPDTIVINAGSENVATIARMRSTKKSNSFTVSIDGTEESTEINPYLTDKINHAKAIRISCPVNVEILDDATGSVVHTLSDGTERTDYTPYGNFYVFPDENGEYVKYADLAEGYSVRINGLREGTMDISVQDISEEKYDPDPYVIEDVPVNTSTHATIKEDPQTGAPGVEVDTNGDQTTDQVYNMTKEELCGEEHHWDRGTMENGKVIYMCSLCGETKQREFSPFPDVNTTDWFYNEAVSVCNNKIMTGYANGAFGPYDHLTRGQVAVVLYRLEKEPAVSGSSPFKDVAAGAYYEKAVTWANQQQIVTGYTDVGEFRPDQRITRQEMATMLYRYSKLKGYDLTQGSYAGFPDAANVQIYAKDAMNWAVGQGLIKGLGNGMLVPQDPLARAQAAVLLHRYMTNFIS